ncbi:unnamed protein product [Vitrella brassicaformis CCMP3155]|uniref:EamA domain-containing protein n=2 Tax=Vitrella brassicaformis TaxID=1169539 RepID=A0A0G4EWC6_VITBC|nr:unnamed protein product [Vitrella brassicaformis CCMP3155]|eukprot:CEM02758.1 unnamed protein product [Vitrella brassicaformis CCMP3155]
MKSQCGAIICIMCIIVVWLTMAELVQGIEGHYTKPYLLTFIAHSAYAFCLPLWFLWRMYHYFKDRWKERKDGLGETGKAAGAASARSWRHGGRSAGSSSSRLGKLEGKGGHAHPHHHHHSVPPKIGYFNWCYFFGASIPIGILAFVSGWFWYLSLPRTSVSGNTAIYQSSCTMVYLISIFVLKERVTWLKSASVTVSFLGVLFISFFPGNAGTEEPSRSLRRDLFYYSELPVHPMVRRKGRSVAWGWGEGGVGRQLVTESEVGGVEGIVTRAGGDDWDIDDTGEEPIHPSLFGYGMCFLSMVLYACYEVFYKKWASHAGDPYPLANSLRFLGLMGCSTLLFAGPPILILDLFPHWGESFELPKGEGARLIVLLASLDTLFNLFLLFAIMLSSPLFTSIGCLLLLPASVFSDLLIHHYRLPFPALIGVGFILLGFIGFTISEMRDGDTLYEYEVLPTPDNRSLRGKQVAPLSDAGGFLPFAHTSTVREQLNGRPHPHENGPTVIGKATNETELDDFGAFDVPEWGDIADYDDEGEGDEQSDEDDLELDDEDLIDHLEASQVSVIRE